MDFSHFFVAFTDGFIAMYNRNAGDHVCDLNFVAVPDVEIRSIRRAGSYVICLSEGTCDGLRHDVTQGCFLRQPWAEFKGNLNNQMDLSGNVLFLGIESTTEVHPLPLLPLFSFFFLAVHFVPPLNIISMCVRTVNAETVLMHSFPVRCHSGDGVEASNIRGFQ